MISYFRSISVRKVRRKLESSIIQEEGACFKLDTRRELPTSRTWDKIRYSCGRRCWELFWIYGSDRFALWIEECFHSIKESPRMAKLIVRWISRAIMRWDERISLHSFCAEEPVVKRIWLIYLSHPKLVINLVILSCVLICKLVVHW